MPKSKSSTVVPDSILDEMWDIIEEYADVDLSVDLTYIIQDIHEKCPALAEILDLPPKHKGPELIYCLQTTGRWLKFGKDDCDNLRVERKLGVGYTNPTSAVDRELYDLLEVHDQFGNSQIWLGHWNDGLKDK